ncbi:MAG: hypothetical protein ABFS34_11910 [Gemmatimonadota bacterium]
MSEPLRITREFDDPAALRAHLDAGGDLAYAVLQGLDLTPFGDDLARTSVHCAVVLGGRADPELLESMRQRGAVLFPTTVFADCVFDPYPSGLYTPERLILDEYVLGEPASARNTLDARIYRQYIDAGRERARDLLTALARRLHDHGMTDALGEFISEQNVVAIMGGHGLERTDEMYRGVALLAGDLTRRGYLLATGGGPGAMEAAHLGAWLADRGTEELDAALSLMAGAPTFEHPLWQDTAARAHARIRMDGAPLRDSLGIPTWHYGHEPPTVFASRIAKYFDNSVREDGLLRIAQAGVVFAPGSAGTVQEIFQDAAQNHYATGAPSPMVFLGRDYWTDAKPVYPLLRRLAHGRAYSEKLFIGDDIADVADWIDRWNPPTPPQFETDLETA